MLASAVDILTTVVASLLPLLSILILFLVQSDTIKLGVIVSSSAIFSLALALMTQARRVEVFAATAAYVFPFNPESFVLGNFKAKRSDKSKICLQLCRR